MSNWIRFHGELRQGKHRGIPRALRFVFLELCLEARPGRGAVELPLGMDLVDGVHDLLGGSRREVQAALDLYTAGPDPSSPSIRIEGAAGALRLVIPSWEAWNPIDSSAERMRRLRGNRVLSSPCDASRDVTGRHAPGDGEPSPDQRRGDQRRSDPPVGPPGGHEPDQAQLPGVDPKPPRAKGEPRRAADMSHRPESWSPSEGHYELGGQQELSRAEVLAEVLAWEDHHRSKGTMIKDFDASFRTWLRRAKDFRRANARPPDASRSTLQRPATEGQHAWKTGREIS